MAVRLSALCVGRALSQKHLLVLISVTGEVNPRAMVRLEGFGKLKSMTSKGFEPLTFRFAE
jgi:hypothetical protein